MRKLTHINNNGEAEMVDVSDKLQSSRTATATSVIILNPNIIRAINESNIKKGDTLVIIEAMKTLNQIPSTKEGKVSRILVEDGTPVEFGSPLVIIE